MWKDRRSRGPNPLFALDLEDSEGVNRRETRAISITVNGLNPSDRSFYSSGTGTRTVESASLREVSEAIRPGNFYKRVQVLRAGVLGPGGTSGKAGGLRTGRLGGRRLKSQFPAEPDGGKTVFRD